MEKTRVKGPDISSANVACLVSREEAKILIALGSLSPVPVVLDVSDLFSKNGGRYAKTETAVLDRVRDSISPITDVRSTGAHRFRVAQAFTKRLLSTLWEGTN